MRARRLCETVTALGLVTALGGTAGTRSAAFAAPARRAANAAVQGRPDATLYQDAQAAETRLRASATRKAKRTEWEAVVLQYRKVVARYPRSGYCDNALLAAGNLYREMAGRFRSSRYREDALAAYRTLVAEYPSSSLGDDALFAVVEVSRQSGDRRKLAESARAYLDTYPEGGHAAGVKRLLRQREPATPLPSPPPRGLARVFDLRSWSGDSSTRVVIDLERKVKLQSDVARDPDRLWIDLDGTRLHPNLARRVFPVGDGLLEQVRIAQNRDDVVRVVLDFKDVWEHQIFYLDDPPRLVVDVQGHSRPEAQQAQAETARAPSVAEPPSPAPPAAVLPARRVNGMVPPETEGPRAAASSAPIAIAGVDRLPGTGKAPQRLLRRRRPPRPAGRPCPLHPPSPPPRTARARTASRASSASASGGS
jgi:N-acetylmuramoyl-L-alanine amidase